MDDIQELLRKLTLDTLNQGHIEMLREEGGEAAAEQYIKNSMSKIENEFKTNAIKQVLQRKYYNYYARIIDEDDKCEHEIYETLKTLKKIKTNEDELKNSDYVFMTASPSEDVDYMSLAKIINKFLKLKYVKKYLLVYEQRFDGENINMKLGDGLHAHFLVQKGDAKPSHIRRDFMRICGGVQINMDMKFIKPADIPKIENYMIGIKACPLKQKKQTQDKNWRSIMNIPDYFGDSFLSEA